MEACVQRDLLDAGATLVSAAIVQKLRGVAAPRELLRGNVPEALTSDDVDVVLAGFSETKLASEALGVPKYEAQLSLSLAKIDTGDLLSSESLHGLGINSSSRPAAARMAVEKLCAQVAPKITAALEKRVARGERVVLEVTGANAVRASALATDLEKMKRVGRARVKKVAKDKAILDVILAGGDGVTFALDVPASAGLVVNEVSAGTVKATLATASAGGKP